MEGNVIRESWMSVNRYLPTAMLLLVAIFWGTSYGIGKEALLFTTVVVFLVIRFLMTTLVLLPIVIYQRNYRNWTSVLPTGVVFTPVIEWVVNKKKPSNQLFLLSFISIAGVFLLTNNNINQLKMNIGDALMLMAALLRGAMVVYTKKIMVDKEVDPILITMVQASVVSVLSIILLFSINGTEFIQLIPVEPSFWFLIMYLVLFCTVFAFYAQNYSVQKMSPTRVSILMGSEPIFGALFAFLWLSESFSMLQMAGATLILIVTFMVTKNKT